MDAIIALIRRVATRADAALSFCEVAFIGAAIAFASLVLFANVVLRYIFLSPISWAEELSIYLLIWIVFIGGSVLVRTGGHITVDLLPRALGPALRRALHALVLLLALGFFAVLFYYGMSHMLRVMASGQRTPIMLAPMWLTYLAVPVGAGLMFLRATQMLWRTLVAGPPEHTPGALND